jgi:hypothetical protein
VHFVVVEAGVYTQAEHGVKMEAVRFTSTVTDGMSSWVGESRPYANAYTSPVVLGQVMSADDPDFSVFWSRGPYRWLAPTPAMMYVGKHAGEDPDSTRANEVIGYIVIEAGAGTFDGREFAAGVGAKTVLSVTNGAPVSYDVSGLSSASTAVVSQAGMSGANGAWALLYGDNPISASQLQLATDEDQLRDPERGHGAEHVAYLVFGPAASALRGNVAADQVAAGQAARLMPEQAEAVADAAVLLWKNELENQLVPEITVSVADLPDDLLGVAAGTSITLDVDANGLGWFVDNTPLDNSEYVTDAARESLIAKSETPAAARYDLLTVIAHELGHVLGSDHHNDGDHLMSESLDPGVRRLPGASQIDDELLHTLAHNVSTFWGN